MIPKSGFRFSEHHSPINKVPANRDARRDVIDGQGATRGSFQGISAMAAKQNILGRIDTGRKVRRPPLVGMQFLHEGSVSTTDFLRAGPGLKAKDLISLLFSHFAAGRSAARLPRSRIMLRVFKPAGLPAVKISHQ